MKRKYSSDYMRNLNARRINKRGGRPPVLRKCPYCKTELSARLMRPHKTQCDRKLLTYRVTSAVGVAGEFSTLKRAKDLLRTIKASGSVPAALRIKKQFKKRDNQ